MKAEMIDQVIVGRLESLGMILERANEIESWAQLVWWFIRSSFVSPVMHPMSAMKLTIGMGDCEQDRLRLIGFPHDSPDLSNMVSTLSKEFTLANALSASRPALVVAANMVGISHPAEYAGLMAVAFMTDAADGWVARKFGPSPAGAFADLVADHSASALMYIYLAGQGIVPGWVPAVTITREAATDVLRAGHFLVDKSLIKGSVLSPGDQPINVLSTSLAVRAGYAGLKAAVSLSAPFSPSAAQLLSEVAAGVCLLRGVPVIFNRQNAKLANAIREM